MFVFFLWCKFDFKTLEMCAFSVYWSDKVKHSTQYRFQNITLHQIEMYILLCNALVINWAQTVLSLKHCCLLICFQPKGLSSQYLSNLNNVFSLLLHTRQPINLCLRIVVYSSFNIHRVYFWILLSICWTWDCIQ